MLEERPTDSGSTLLPDDSGNAINDGHYFELMDQASVAVDYIYQFIGSHPLIRKARTLRETYERAEEALAETPSTGGQAGV